MYSRRIKVLWIIRTTDPHKIVVVLRMAGIGYGLQKLGEAMATTTIFRRSLSRTANAARVHSGRLRRLDALIDDRVVPVIAEVVHIQERRYVVINPVGDILLPACPARRSVKFVIVWNPDPIPTTSLRMEQNEFV
jgi:hypothetical protein